MKTGIVTSVLAALSLGLQTSFADSDHEKVRRLMTDGEIVSLEVILAKVREQVPGRILEAEIDEKKGTLIYEIEILDDQGTVWELRYDARNAELLKKEKED